MAESNPLGGPLAVELEANMPTEATKHVPGPNTNLGPNSPRINPNQDAAREGDHLNTNTF